MNAHRFSRTSYTPTTGEATATDFSANFISRSPPVTSTEAPGHNTRYKRYIIFVRY